MKVEKFVPDKVILLASRKEGRLMTHKAFLKLRELLNYRRREMLEQVAHLEFERDELEQHFIESTEKHNMPKEGKNV